VRAADEASSRSQEIVVLLPCLNEEQTIEEVVEAFRQALPQARIVVFDNNSTDATRDRALQAGAEVVASPLPGKGSVVQHMLRSVHADIYVMADGDGTYPAEAAPELLRALEDSGADMIVGSRLEKHNPGAFRAFHKLGNRIISRLISGLFRTRLTDVLSGYRVMRRRLVRSMQLRSRGFEVETEMTLQALVHRRSIVEVPIHYRERPPGSVSKLRSFADGIHILKLIVLIFKDYKPLWFFMNLSLVCFVAGILAGWHPVDDYIRHRYVYHVPLALLAAALEIMAALFAGIGLVLDAIRRFHFEVVELLDRVQRGIDTSDPSGE
jgi:glycosyltransferase involved in cell wall biosynthesis